MNALNEDAYKIILKVQPSLLGVIGDLLNKNQSPKQIADRVAKRDVALAGLVEMAADYMQEREAQANKRLQSDASPVESVEK